MIKVALFFLILKSDLHNGRHFVVKIFRLKKITIRGENTDCGCVVARRDGEKNCMNISHVKKNVFIYYATVLRRLYV